MKSVVVLVSAITLAVSMPGLAYAAKKTKNPKAKHQAERVVATPAERLYDGEPLYTGDPNTRDHSFVAPTNGGDAQFAPRVLW